MLKKIDPLQLCLSTRNSSPLIDLLRFSTIPNHHSSCRTQTASKYSKYLSLPISPDPSPPNLRCTPSVSSFQDEPPPPPKQQIRQLPKDQAPKVLGTNTEIRYFTVFSHFAIGYGLIMCRRWPIRSRPCSYPPVSYFLPFRGVCFASQSCLDYSCWSRASSRGCFKTLLVKKTNNKSQS